MGQKLNPIIFRLGVNKTWKTEFFEKKNRELPLYIYKDLEIKNYLERVLETYGILLHDYKQHHNDSILNLYISYFVTPNFMLDKRKFSAKIKLKSTIGEKIVVKKLSNKFQFTRYLILFNKKTRNLLDNSFRSYELKQYLKLNSYIQLFTSLYFVQLQQFLIIENNKYLRKSLNSSDLLIKSILFKIFKVLNMFMGNQLKIVINFCCINKNMYYLKSRQEKFLISLQKFRNTLFFKEGIELLFHVVYNSNSANLLAKFIAFQLKKIKRHKFFLSFLKQTLNTLVNSNLSKIKGVKIIVKGRLNGVPRAKYKIVIIGDVPVQTISTKLDYSQSTAHNSNGSYGIKVWIVEK